MVRVLSFGKSEMIGLIVLNILDIFYVMIVYYVEWKVKVFGYNVVFSSLNEDLEIEK